MFIHIEDTFIVWYVTNTSDSNYLKLKLWFIKSGKNFKMVKFTSFTCNDKEKSILSSDSWKALVRKGLSTHRGSGCVNW